MSLTKCYWMLQNARVIAFIVSELLRENQEIRVNQTRVTQIRLGLVPSHPD